MSSVRRAVSAVAAMLIALGLALAGFLAVPAFAANEGTIKVTNDSQCGGPDNQPKVESPFYVGGVGFDPNEAYTLEFATQPGGTVVLSTGGTTSATGTFCNGPLTLPAGSYKVTFTDAGGNKSKVFSVETGSTSTPTGTSTATSTSTSTATSTSTSTATSTSTSTATSTSTSTATSTSTSTPTEGGSVAPSVTPTDATSSPATTEPGSATATPTGTAPTSTDQAGGGTLPQTGAGGLLAASAIALVVLGTLLLLGARPRRSGEGPAHL